MRLRVFIIAALLLSVSCKRESSAPSPVQVSPQTNVDLNEASETELLAHVGERVTMHGQWSLYGLEGPYIVTANGRSIYLVSKGNFSWGKEYSRIEGKDVRVTGILRHAHYEPSPEQHPPDHFYFDSETAKIELNKN